MAITGSLVRKTFELGKSSVFPFFLRFLHECGHIILTDRQTDWLTISNRHAGNKMKDGMDRGEEDNIFVLTKGEKHKKGPNEGNKEKIFSKEREERASS